VFVVGFLLLVVNSLRPYLGLKQESSFAMFSNLQTEGADWNHAFIPEAVRVFGYQEQLVRVTASNDRALLARSRGGTGLVRIELERHLRMNPDATATYATAAGTLRTARAPQARSWSTPLLDRFMKFRDVRPPERRGC